MIHKSNQVWCWYKARVVHLWRPVPKPSMCSSSGCSVRTRRRRTGPARRRTSWWRWAWGCRYSGSAAGPPRCTGGRRLAHTRGRGTGRAPLGARSRPLFRRKGPGREPGWWVGGERLRSRRLFFLLFFFLCRPPTERTGATWERQPRSHPSYVCLQQRVVRRWSDVSLRAQFQRLTAPPKTGELCLEIMMKNTLLWKVPVYNQGHECPAKGCCKCWDCCFTPVSVFLFS